MDGLLLELCFCANIHVFNYEKHFEKSSKDKNFLLNFHYSLLELDNHLQN